MNILLKSEEARVLGSLMEKEITTPEYYPISLNALTNACNQKSNRDPVVLFDEPTVVKALDSLREKKLACLISVAGSRVPKFKQLFTETIGIDPAETAIMTELMVRGPQTVGELRTRAGRLFSFTDTAQVEAALDGLMKREHIRLIAKLPRQTGYKECRYTHLLCGDTPAVTVEAVAALEPAMPPETIGRNDRTVQLETEIRLLRADLDDLKQQFLQFRRSFE